MTGPSRRFGISVIDQEWMAEGLCVGEPVDLWFPDSAGDGDATSARWDEARAICEQCPVRDECGQYAETHRINDGMWGGTTPKERRRRRRDARRAQAHTRQAVAA